MGILARRLSGPWDGHSCPSHLKTDRNVHPTVLSACPAQDVTSRSGSHARAPPYHDTNAPRGDRNSGREAQPHGPNWVAFNPKTSAAKYVLSCPARAGGRGGRTRPDFRSTPIHR